MIKFVDNKRHYVIFLHQKLMRTIIKEMETSINAWNKLLIFSGGALKTSKYAWYILLWASNGKDEMTLQQTKEKLVIDNNGN